MTKTRSIALFMHDFSGGGVERMRLALATALAARGISVSLVVVRAEGPLRHQVPASIMVEDLGCSRALFALVKLRRYLQAHQPDFLVSSLDHNNIVALCAALWTRTATRVVMCQHNTLSQELGQGLRYRAIPILYWLLQARAAAIVAVSQGVAGDLIRTARLHDDRVSVIGNPVIRDDNEAAHEPPHPPHPWLVDRAVPVFVFVGRLVAQKDPATLIHAFANRLTSGPARLIVLGDGPLRRDMERLAASLGIADTVHFGGYVSNPDAWIVWATALVLTSRYEGFGNVIVEALACGTPVIATACPHGPAEILDQGRYGDLVPVGDATAIARAMESDLRMRFDAAFLRARSRHYTVSRCADQHIALFDRLGWCKRYRAFGLELWRETAANIAARIMDERPATGVRLVVTPNANHIRLLSSRAFRQACRRADIVCPDGWPVSLYASLRHATKMPRVTGCDIFHHLTAHADARFRRVLVVTESTGTDTALRAWLDARQWSQSWRSVCARPNVMADRSAQLELLSSIWEFKPDMLVMTLGAPTSEVFVHAYQRDLPPCWALCVGQAVRVELGLMKRAPRYLQRVGLEWAWRCAREPRRLGMRYLSDLLWFPVAMIQDLWWPQGVASRRSSPRR